MAMGVLGVDVDTGCAGDPVGGHVKVVQRLDDGLFKPEDVFAHEKIQSREVHQGVGHNLSRPVVGDLPPTIGFDAWNVCSQWRQSGLLRQAQGVDAWVLTKPKLVRISVRALSRELLHRFISM